MAGSRTRSPRLVGTLALFAAGAGFAAGSPASPQDKTPVPAAAAPVTAIKGGDIWTVTNGVVKRGTLLIQGGKISKVGGPDLAVPEGATVIDAAGKVVGPGFVVANTGGPGGAGLIKSGAGKIKDALDPFGLPVSLALATGITSVYVAGGSGGQGGSGGDEAGGSPGTSGLSSSNAVIKMSAGDMSGMLLKEPVSTTFTIPSSGGAGGGFGGARRGSRSTGTGSQMSARRNLRDLLTRAAEYRAKLDAYEKAGKKGAAPSKPPGIDEALPLVRKERALRLTVADVGDIRWALGLTDEFGLRLVLAPATEAWVIADEIAKRDVMLVIAPRNRTPGDERLNRPNGSSPDAAGILGKAGVKFAVVPGATSFGTGGEMGRDLLTYPLEAAYAMRAGLDAQSALESVTITPARILGLADRIGSIEEGKDADIVIFGGDPLDYRVFAEKTLVNGKVVYDKDTSSFFSYVKTRTAIP